MARIVRTRAAQKARAREVYERLRAAYPDARCSLDFTTPLQLLIATVLAAQCTDERVNIVTRSLFARYPDAAAYLRAPQQELEEAVRSCGFYRNKAKSIRRACAAIVERFGGELPGTMDELLTLDGVGRKTANVILCECFGTPGIVVDTHCGRLARRLGFTKAEDPGKVEQDLMKLLPAEDWRMFSHSLVFHGRAICQARGPKCSKCPVADQCPFPDTPEGKRVAR